MIKALGGLLEQGKIKIYSVDSVAGRAWVSGEHSTRYCSWLQNRFDEFLYHELVPWVREDCNSPEIEIVTAGASIGAYHALTALCRHPDVFSHAICMSGTYDLEKFLQGPPNDDFYYSSPLHFLPNLTDGGLLEQLRKRFVLLTHGQGRWEEPEQSWRAAHVLGAKGVPNRVDPWSEAYDHDWTTWRSMLPHYLAELA